MKADLSYVNSMDELLQKEHELRKRIESREEILQKEIPLLPGKIFKTTVRKSAPFLLGAAAFFVGVKVFSHVTNKPKIDLPEKRGFFTRIANSSALSILIPFAGKILTAFNQKRRHNKQAQ